MSHLVLIGLIALKLWRQFASCAGIIMEETHLQHQITKWWTMDSSTRLHPILKVVPLIIIWFLWRRRNLKRHDKDMYFDTLAYQVQYMIVLVTKAKYPQIRNDTNWNGLLQVIKSYKPKLFHYPVRWTFPNPNWTKGNIDSACRGNPGISVYGFCLRDQYGNLVYVEVREIGHRTSMEAESMAMLRYVRYCMQHQIQPISLETDSLNLLNIIRGVWKIPWNIREKINEIKLLLQANIQHIYREANQLADNLVNQALDKEGSLICHNFQKLPKQCKKMINSDKAQICTLCIKHHLSKPMRIKHSRQKLQERYAFTVESTMYIVAETTPTHVLDQLPKNP